MQFINKDGFMFWVQSSNRIGKKIHQFASLKKLSNEYSL